LKDLLTPHQGPYLQKLSVYDSKSTNDPDCSPLPHRWTRQTFNRPPKSCIGSTGSRLRLDDRDVPDLIGGTDQVFNDCAVLIEAGTALHLP